MPIDRPITNIETRVPDNVFIYSQTDLKGRIVEANQAFADLSGYAIEEMIGKPHNIVRHPDMPSEAFADMWKSLKAGRPWRGVVKNRRSDGGYYWVLANASPVREDGRVVGYQSLRSRPSAQQIQTAELAYRRICQGDASLAIHEGRVVHTRNAWAKSIARPDVQFGVLGLFALVAPLCGFMQLAASGSRILEVCAAVVYILCGLASLFVLFKTLPSLRNDLAQLEAYLDGILSSGNLLSSIDLEQQERSGNIARKLLLLVGWVQSTVQCVLGAVIPVQEGTAQVLKAIQSIDEAAKSQNIATSSVAAATTQLDLTIREVSQHMQNTESAVRESGDRASGGVEVSVRATDRIQLLATTIKEAAVEVEKLSVSTAEVGTIASAIREIADQTNLLALNASIEAARAGEAGKGFAVVANEVRSLADRTTRATAQIDAIIDTIRADSDRAIAGMRTGAAQVGDGVALVREAQETLTGINQLMAGAVRKVSEIAVASTQQTEAMEEISSNITRVASMTEQNVESVNSASELMNHLAPMVDSVRKAVAQYRV